MWGFVVVVFLSVLFVSPPSSACSAAKVFPVAGASGCFAALFPQVFLHYSLDKPQKPPSGPTGRLLGRSHREPARGTELCERQSTKPNITCKPDLIQACGKERSWSENSFKEHGANQSMNRAGDKPNFGGMFSPCTTVNQGAGCGVSGMGPAGVGREFGNRSTSRRCLLWQSVAFLVLPLQPRRGECRCRWWLLAEGRRYSSSMSHAQSLLPVLWHQTSKVSS